LSLSLTDQLAGFCKASRKSELPAKAHVLDARSAFP
jgi:hypothetical protein